MPSIKIFIFLICFSSLISCNKNNEDNVGCICTQMACIVNENPDITLKVDLNVYSWLDEDDFKNITVIQTDLNNNRLDSIKMQFEKENNSQNLQLIIGSMSTPFEASFKQSKFIIRNPNLIQTDTLSEIEYNTTEVQRVCNQCSGGPDCMDEMVTDYNYSSPTIKFNQTQNNSFEINYLIRA